MRAYAWRRQADIADDVVAETFLVAWRRLDQVPQGGELPWLLGVARKVRLNLRRGDRRRSALADRLRPVAAARPAAEPPDGRLARALGRLAERDREILLLDAWEGLDNAAIARVLRCSRATVAVRKSRARRRLQALLADRPTNDPNLSRTAIGGTPDVR